MATKKLRIIEELRTQSGRHEVLKTLFVIYRKWCESGGYDMTSKQLDAFIDSSVKKHFIVPPQLMDEFKRDFRGFILDVKGTFLAKKLGF